MAELVAERLGRDGLRAAYALIRLSDPAIELGAWLRFARRLTRGDPKARGIMAVRHAGRRFPCGLFCYRCERDLRQGRVMTAEHLVALDLLDATAVRAGLLRALAKLAAELGCEAVRLVAPAAPLAVLLGAPPRGLSLAATSLDR